MNETPFSNTKSFLTSAVKWGLLHSAVCIGIAFVFKLLMNAILRIGLTGVIVIGAYNVMFYSIWLVVSYFFFKMGLSEYRDRIDARALSIKWTSVFTSIFLLIYGAYRITITYLSLGSMGFTSEAMRNYEMMSLAFYPVLAAVVLATVILFLEGLVVGWMLQSRATV